MSSRAIQVDTTAPRFWMLTKNFETEHRKAELVVSRRSKKVLSLCALSLVALPHLVQEPSHIPSSSAGNSDTVHWDPLR